MAGYQACADALLAVLIAKSPASTYVKGNNSSAKGNWLALDAGYDTSYVITPGSHVLERSEFRWGHRRTWICVVNVAARYTEDGVVYNNLALGIQAVIDTVDAWAKLNATSGVYQADAVSVDEPVPLMDRSGGGPFFIMQAVRVRIIEEVEVTENE